jgi:hypothetical protein
MQKRRRFKQETTLQDRVRAWAEQVREEAGRLPPGPDRDTLLKKVRQTEMAMHLDRWTNSPGLQPPK